MPNITGDESVKTFGGMAAFGGAALVAASLLLLSPASAQSDRTKAQRAAALRAGPTGAFTPAVADPRLAAALARRGNGAGSFRLTPTAADRRQPVRVAVRARTAAPQAGTGVQTASGTPVTAITPTSYNLGASVGWRRLAISGDVAESRDGIISGRRASAQVGVSYRADQRITARIRASAEQTEGRQRIVTDDQAYAVDVGGSYSIARNLDVTGGVRYRIARDRIEPLAADQRRDSQAVYIGTAFRF